MLLGKYLAAYQKLNALAENLYLRLFEFCSWKSKGLQKSTVLSRSGKIGLIEYKLKKSE